MDMLRRNPSDHHQCSHKCTQTAMEMEMEWVQAGWAPVLELVR
jgi:hypothetical protein